MRLEVGGGRQRCKIFRFMVIIKRVCTEGYRKYIMAALYGMKVLYIYMSMAMCVYICLYIYMLVVYLGLSM